MHGHVNIKLCMNYGKLRGAKAGQCSYTIFKESGFLFPYREEEYLMLCS